MLEDSIYEMVYDALLLGKTMKISAEFIEDLSFVKELFSNGHYVGLMVQAKDGSEYLIQVKKNSK